MSLLNPEDSTVFKQWLTSYIDDIERHPRVFTLLHAVCRFTSRDTNMIEFLLNAGASPLAIDEDGNSPLYYHSMCVTLNKTAVHLLLNGGAHLDQANDRGETPLQNMKRNQLYLAKRNLAPDPYQDYLCNTNNFLPLQSLCARVIRQNRILFNHLPPVSLLLKNVELNMVK